MSLSVLQQPLEASTLFCLFIHSTTVLAMGIPPLPAGAVQLTVHELESTFGVLFVGYVVAMTAYGFTFFQTYIYYNTYTTDHWGIKATVAAVSILDTVTSALISHALYHYLIVLFPYTEGLYRATSTFTAEVALSIIAVFIVQIYYTARIWELSKNAVVSGAIAVVSSTALALGIVMTAELGRDSQFVSLAASRVKSVVAAGQALTFVSGLLIFGALSFYLAPAQAPKARRVEGWYDNIVVYTMSHCSLATVVQLGFFIAFIAMPAKVIWMPFHLLASKLFVNSLLTMLNSRKVHNGKGLNEETVLHKAGDAAFSTSTPGTHSAMRFDATDSSRTESSYHGMQSTAQTKKVYNDDDDTSWQDPNSDRFVEKQHRETL
ncbi:hypothetical protein BDQ12DRAFT_679695 [Crucibulum laeve]|uniref:DUF6534 domain-containing protein n=1 Tax=Crucibulum laeve TaxID=68775 RepID=A0A5C3M7C5_9AGAR|nr:hypothetical protein BDQ12DRAFT_679695 [Crucibulum laeve]